jgi:hypothetical protein
LTLTVQYMTDRPQDEHQEPSPSLKIVNEGTASVPLAELTLRYWYTIDSSDSQVWTCWFATSAGGCGEPLEDPSEYQNMSGSFVTVSRPGADRYLQISFSGGAGSVGAASSVQLEGGFHKTDWSDYTQTNDYSFDASTAWADWTHVTLYRNDILVWGTEP